MVISEQLDLQEMINMEINSSFQLSMDMKVIRVPNGWIYQTLRTSVFVPLGDFV